MRSFLYRILPCRGFPTFAVGNFPPRSAGEPRRLEGSSPAAVGWGTSPSASLTPPLSGETLASRKVCGNCRRIPATAIFRYAEFCY